MLLALLALCEGNPPVTGGFTSQRTSNVGHWYLLCCLPIRNIGINSWVASMLMCYNTYVTSFQSFSYTLCFAYVMVFEDKLITNILPDSWKQQETLPFQKIYLNYTFGTAITKVIILSRYFYCCICLIYSIRYYSNQPNSENEGVFVFWNGCLHSCMTLTHSWQAQWNLLHTAAIFLRDITEFIKPAGIPSTSMSVQ